MRPGRSVTARRVSLTVLAAGALATGSAATVAWGQTPDQTIDAGTNAQQAADALNSGCVDMDKCSWEADTPLQYLYNSPRIIGDVLYNCSTGADDAETAIGVSDSRGETTSISESISVEMSLGFLGLEESSVEFKAFSGQSQGFSQEVKVVNAVEVPRGFKGWTEASVLSAGVTGSAYITQGIHLIRVSDIDLQFPGYEPRSGPAKPQVVYSGFSQAMTADENTSRCGAVGPGTGNGAQGARVAKARQAAARTERFKLTVCHSRSTKRSGRRCAARTVTGSGRRPRPG